MINDLDLIKNGKMLIENDVILYGASNCGKSVVELCDGIGVKPAFFMDSDKEKCGRKVNGVEVKSMEYAKKYVRENNCILIITSMYVDEIDKYLEEEQFLQGRVFTMYALRYGMHFLIMQGGVSSDYTRIYKTMFEQWKKQYLDPTRAVQLNERCGGIIDEEIFDVFAYSPIWVYQPGKVGSSTIFKSIRDIGKKCIHTHDIPYQMRLKYGEEGYSKFKESIKKINKKVIVTVRDPIGRDLSMFAYLTEFIYMGLIQEELSGDFVQSFYEYLGKYTGKYSDKTKAGYTWKEYIAENFRYGAEIDWFDLEIKELFGIDVFEEGFDKEQGYSIISGDNIEILVMQMEKVNKLEGVIAEFIGDDFKIGTLNEAKDFSYHYAYNQLKEQVIIPQEYLDLYYGPESKLHHFYSDSDIEKFRKKWSK